MGNLIEKLVPMCCTKFCAEDHKPEQSILHVCQNYTIDGVPSYQVLKGWEFFSGDSCADKSAPFFFETHQLIVDIFLSK